MKKRTKILCTLGPSTESVEVITKLVNAGMNVARLNFSHGTHENHETIINNVREVEKNTGIPIAILQDLQGPKIRVGKMPQEGVDLVVDQEIIFDTSLDEYQDGKIPVGYKDLHNHVKSGERLLLNDGNFEVEVISVSGTEINTKIILGGNLTSHKGINVPDSKLSIDVITEKDKDDLFFGIQKGVDLVALSFVMRAQDIIDLRNLINQYQQDLNISPEQQINIIAKIERREAVQEIKSILKEVDGIMIARGDLGIEIPAQEVPVVQKNLIIAARNAAKPVIVATQMLDSMQDSPRPTRAEVSDVANAVMDHTDAVMLSNETSTGKYPVESVETMTKIIIEAERSMFDDTPVKDVQHDNQPVDDVISEMSKVLADKTHAKLILSASLGGNTARLISRYRPELPVLIATKSKRTWRQLVLSWGIVPFIALPCENVEDLVEKSIEHIKQHHILNKQDVFIVVAGEPVGEAGHVNILEVREIV